MYLRENEMMGIGVVAAALDSVALSRTVNSWLGKLYTITSSRSDENHTSNYNMSELNDLLRPQVCVVHLISDLELLSCAMCFTYKQAGLKAPPQFPS